MATARTSEKTKYPGIRKLSRDGIPAGFLVSYRIPGLGQRTRTLPTLREAKEFQASVRDPANAQKMRSLAKGRITVAQYFDMFLERRRNLTASTRLRYEGVGRNYIIPSRLGRLSLNSVSRDDVEEWVTGLQARKVGPPTIEKSHHVLRTMFTEAVRDGRALFNPASGVKTPDYDEREPFFLTPVQVDQIVEAAPARERALIYFLAQTGLRIGEASALRVRRVDLEHGKVTVRENSAEVGGKKVTGKTKTKKGRVVYFSKELLDELNAHLAEYGVRRADGTLDPDAYMFTAPGGGQVRQNNYRERVFQRAALKAGVTRLGEDGELEPPWVHDLRHTFASIAAANGYTLHEVKEALGHSDIGITSRLYLHLFPDDKRDKAQRLGKLISPPAARDAVAGVVQLEGRKAGNSSNV